MYTLSWTLIFIGFFQFIVLKENSRLSNNIHALQERLPISSELYYDIPSNLHVKSLGYVENVLPHNRRTPVRSYNTHSDLMSDSSSFQNYYATRPFFRLPTFLRRSPNDVIARERRAHRADNDFEKVLSTLSKRQGRTNQNNYESNPTISQYEVNPVCLKRSVESNEKNTDDKTEASSTENHTLQELASDSSFEPVRVTTSTHADQEFLNPSENSTISNDQLSAYENLIEDFLRARKEMTTYSTPWPSLSTPTQHDPGMIVGDVGDLMQALIQSTPNDEDGPAFFPFQLVDQPQFKEHIPTMNASSTIPPQNGAPPSFFMQGVYPAPVAFRLPPGQMAFLPGQQQVPQPVNPRLIPNQALQLLIPAQNQLTQSSLPGAVENTHPVPGPAIQYPSRQLVYPGKQGLYPEENTDLESKQYLEKIERTVPRKFQDEAFLLSLAKSIREHRNATFETQPSTTTQKLEPIQEDDYNNDEYNEAEMKAYEALQNLPPVHMPVREIRVPLETFGIPPVTIGDLDITNIVNNISADNDTWNKNLISIETSTNRADISSTESKLKLPDLTANSGKVLLKIMNELEEIKMDRSPIAAKEGLPCQVGGSWVSDIAGIRLDMDVMANGSMAVQVANRVPPKESGLLTHSWLFSGESPFQRNGVFSIFAKNPVTKRLATFVGQCRVCGGAEMVTGMWLIAREPRNCRDTHLSVTQHPDVFRREILHLLKNKKLRDVGSYSSTEETIAMVNTNSTSTSTSNSASTSTTPSTSSSTKQISTMRTSGTSTIS